MNEIVKTFSDNLDSLCEGLLVMSETDAPMKPFEWKKIQAIDEVAVKEKLKKPAESSLETLTIDEFFKISVTSQDWHGEIEKKSVEGFQQVVNFLNQNLKDIKVFKTNDGEARREVVVVGLTENGHCAGLKTYTVET